MQLRELPTRCGSFGLSLVRLSDLFRISHVNKNTLARRSILSTRYLLHIATFIIP